MTETRSTCPYCGVGCGVVIETDGAQITGVRGDPDHPANFGRLCSKGQTLHLTAAPSIALATRLLQPMRRERRGEAPQPIDWPAALDDAAERIRSVHAAHGPDAIGLYISGQLLTEDYYVFNKLAKGLLGSNNIDTNSRLCMSSAVAGYKATLGADAPPACYDDIALADTLFIAGSNAAWAHPVLFRRIEDAKRAKPALKIVVADPRRTETAEAADLHLPLLPGSDVALCHGLLHLMLWEGLCDTAFIDAHTRGFEQLRDRVRDFTPKQTAHLTGLREADLVQAARWFGQQHTQRRGATLSLYCQGLNQSSSGTAKNVALINLHLATGQIGKPGAGPFSLTGQPNAMGGREVGGMANLLSGHRDLANAEHRAEVARLWGVADVPARPGKTAVELFEAAADGQVKLLWIACTNPAQSMPDQRTVRRALQRAEHVIVQEAFATTTTCAFADLLLPATTWGEKDGTVTNSERRISRVRAALPPAGQARHDWRIAVDIAQRLEPRLRPGAPTLFPYPTAEAIWNEHRETTRGRDLDITALSWARLDADGPQQWPCPAGTAVGRHDDDNAGAGSSLPALRQAGKARLYEDRRFATADGRAAFADVPFTPPAEPRDARYPFSLTSGRLRDQWHGGSRTGTLGRLFGHVAEPCIELNGGDMARLQLADGDLVHVTTRRGSLVLPAQASAQLAPMQAFVAMHWGEEFVGGCSASGQAVPGINLLFPSARCPTSQQPELKHAAAKVLKAELPWRLLALAFSDGEPAAVLRERLRARLAGFAFSAAVPFGREREGVLLRAAAHEPPGDEWLAALEALLGLGTGPDVLRYADRRRAQRRVLKVTRAADGEPRLQALLLAGDTAAEAWLRPLLQQQRSVEPYRRRLLSPGAAPADLAPRGRQVCTCLDVAEPQIVQALARSGGAPEDERIAELQRTLKCGTQCGSCLPELRRLARRPAPA